MIKNIQFHFIFFILCLSYSQSFSQETLKDIIENDRIKCGVDSEKLGFASLNNQGRWEGFDADICRAIAAAALKDAEFVSFKPVSAQSRFPALNSGEIDVLTRSTTWTLTRDTEFSMNFVGPIFYDGQSIMLLKELEIKDVKELDSAKICLPSNTTAPKNAADFFSSLKINYQPAFVNSTDYGYMDTYLSGYCDAVINDITALASDSILRSKEPNLYTILPYRISKEPLSIGIRHGDPQWYDIVKWTYNALLIAEDLGINQNNITQLKRSSNNQLVKIFLGSEPGLGKLIGLDDQWAYRIIKQVGNYKEIYDRNILNKLQIERGINALWKNGGLMNPPTAMLINIK